MKKQKIRAFISIDLPKNIQKEILKIQRQLPGFDGKLIGPENLHLTLKFLGEVDSEILIEIKRRLKEIKFKKFECEVKGLGLFDNGKSKKYSRKVIIWLHLTNCDGIQKIIDDKLLGIFKKEKRFMSHLTIARAKFIKNKKGFLGELKKIQIPKLKFKVKSFTLKKSELFPEGPVYETLEVYPLTDLSS